MAMFEITNRTQAPYSSICYIRCEWADGTATRASGVVVGYNDVLTALHVVYDTSRGGWAKTITITPAADTSPFFTSPWGSWTNVGSVVGLAANWDLDGDGLLTEKESQGDVALLGLSSRIGDTTGWLPVAQVPNGFAGTMVGYPARGTGMMAEDVDAAASGWADVYLVQASLGAGASGGPLLASQDGRTVVTGVLSAGTDADSVYAGLFNPDTWNWLQAGMAANDSLLGYSPSPPPAAGTLYTGTNAADHFTGTAGRDTFNGRGGNDSFDGAGEIDTALYSGARAGYQVTVTNGVVQVRDLTAFRDGTDTLTNVERIRFSDSAIAFDIDGHAGQAYRLYQAAFDRAPDLSGLGFQMNKLDIGFGITDIAANFIESPEFGTRYGNLNNTQFATQLYRNVLHREPDAQGLADHVRDLDNGLPRSYLLVHFSESPENEALVIGAIQGGMAYTA